MTNKKNEATDVKTLRRALPQKHSFHQKDKLNNEKTKLNLSSQYQGLRFTLSCTSNITSSSYPVGNVFKAEGAGFLVNLPLLPSTALTETTVCSDAPLTRLPRRATVAADELMLNVLRCQLTY